jgi:hypothetical protein
MSDDVLATFLEGQREPALALSDQSDILELTSLEGKPPDRYVADFRCRTVIRENGRILFVDRIIVGIRFPQDYMRVFAPERLISILAPRNIWLPNVRGPLLCPGHMRPGTPMVDLLFQIHEVLSGQRVTLDERWALNAEACAWARRNRHMLPTDRRPLCRRTRGTSVATEQAEARA